MFRSRRRHSLLYSLVSSVLFVVCGIVMAATRIGETVGGRAPAEDSTVNGVPCVSATGTRVKCGPAPAPAPSSAPLAVLAAVGLGAAGFLGAAAWTMARPLWQAPEVPAED